MSFGIFLKRSLPNYENAILGLRNSMSYIRILAFKKNVNE